MSMHTTTRPPDQQRIEKPRHFEEQNGRENRSISDLLKELRHESTALIQQEIALAKAEIGEKAADAARNVAYVSVGAMIAYCGLWFILLGISGLIWWGLAAAGMNPWPAAWIAPGILGVVIGVIGALFIGKALRHFSKESFMPEQTTESLEEDKQWLKEKIK